MNSEGEFSSIDDSELTPVKVLAGDKLATLELPDFMASDAVTIPADGMLRIVREVPDPAQQGKTIYLILAEAKIPDGIHEALVLLSPLAKPEGNLLFRTNVQDLAKFKGGDRLYINLSDSNIRVRLGTTTVDVKPRQANIYKAPAMAAATNMPIMYEFYHPERKQWMILSASTIILRPSPLHRSRRLQRQESRGLEIAADRDETGRPSNIEQINK